MRTKLRSKLSLLFIALAALIAIPAVVALADTVNVNELNFAGDVTKAPGDTGTIEVYLTELNAEGDVNGCNATGSSPATVTLTSSNPKVTIDSPGSVTLTGCGATAKATIGYSVASDATGSSTISASTPSGGKTGSKWVTTDTLKVLINSPNVAPTDPGAPSLASGSNPNNSGAFSLSWDPSTDTADSVNDSVTYTLQHKDTNDAAFSNVATGLTSASYSFAGSSAEAEGTWLYRVQASDGQLTSAFSGNSSAIVVDKSQPSAPNASTTPADPDYSDWFKDSVTVSYSGSTDPNLLDTSLGSGIASYSAAQPFNASGTHNYSGTATDNAGNVSSATTGTVKVDASNPTFGVCPAGGPFELGSGSKTVGPISASDGESGVDSDASTLSGTVDTSTIGTKQVTFTAVDNVGHEVTKQCSYSVIYKFDGFRSPVDNPGTGATPVFNSAKAGQAIPVKFSLSGNQGLNILNPSTPVVTQVSCPNSATVDPVEEFAQAGNSGLTYDAAADQYNYVWKTTSAFANKCWKLDVKLADGTSHLAYFKFTK